MKSAIFLAVTAVAIASAYDLNRAIGGVSWGPQRIDVFGVIDDDIWHKYYTPAGWEPAGKFETFKGAQSYTPVSVTSWGTGRLDLFFINFDDQVCHKYYTGYDWAPEGDDYETLGNTPMGPLAVNSWGENRIDIVGWSPDSHYVHKAYTGKDWYPSGEDWEDLGGDFASAPTIVSSAPGRLDIFGITNAGNISHKFWNQDAWIPAGKEWEDLGGIESGFTGRPLATSPYAGRVDIWAISDASGSLHHLFWDVYTWRGWEDLGGNFTRAPAITHWSADRTDILGKSANSHNSYSYKFYDGHQWNGWYDKGGSWKTEPTLVSLGDNNLNMFGVDKAGELKLQVWDGSQWLPDSENWYGLGNLEDVSASEDVGNAEARFRIPELVKQEGGRVYESEKKLAEYLAKIQPELR